MKSHEASAYIFIVVRFLKQTPSRKEVTGQTKNLFYGHITPLPALEPFKAAFGLYYVTSHGRNCNITREKIQ